MVNYDGHRRGIRSSSLQWWAAAQTPEERTRGLRKRSRGCACHPPQFWPKGEYLSKLRRLTPVVGIGMLVAVAMASAQSQPSAKATAAVTELEAVAQPVPMTRGRFTAVAFQFEALADLPHGTRQQAQDARLAEPPRLHGDEALIDHYAPQAAPMMDDPPRQGPLTGRSSKPPPPLSGWHHRPRPVAELPACSPGSSTACANASGAPPSGRETMPIPARNRAPQPMRHADQTAPGGHRGCVNETSCVQDRKKNPTPGNPQKGGAPEATGHVWTCGTP
jgi:hypothetical protein